MAFMNKAERDALLDELKDLKLQQITGKMRRMSGSRLAFYRNSQETGRWMTRYVVQEKGVQITLVESYATVKGKADFALSEIVVEPTAENRL